MLRAVVAPPVIGALEACKPKDLAIAAARSAADKCNPSVKFAADDEPEASRIVGVAAVVAATTVAALCDMRCAASAAAAFAWATARAAAIAAASIPFPDMCPDATCVLTQLHGAGVYCFSMHSIIIRSFGKARIPHRALMIGRKSEDQSTALCRRASWISLASGWRGCRQNGNFPS